MLAAMSNVKKTSEVSGVKQPELSDAAMKIMSDTLIKECRSNVYPNKFFMKSGVEQKFRVSVSKTISKKKEFFSFGEFNCVETASYVGSVASLAVYGTKALRGNYDESVVAASAEYAAWEADPANAETLEKAQCALIDLANEQAALDAANAV